MQEIKLYILKRYGILLTDEQIKQVITWYNKNVNNLSNGTVLDVELRMFLMKEFKGTLKHVFNQDNSNVEYLLTLLKSNSSEGA